MSHVEVSVSQAKVVAVVGDTPVSTVLSGVSSSFTYDSQGRISTMTTSIGTKTITYNPDGTVASVVGTGGYATKSMTWVGGVLQSVLVA